MPKTKTTKSKGRKASRAAIRDLPRLSEKAKAVRGGAEAYCVKDKQKVEIQNPSQPSPPQPASTTPYVRT